METLERLEVDADLAQLFSLWSSHLEEEEKCYLVDDLSYLINDEINLEPAERKLHSVLFFTALKSICGEVREEEETYFESCHWLLEQGCLWSLYLEIALTCRWGRFLLEGLRLLPHQRAVETMQQTLATDNCYFDHIVLEACIARLCVASKKEELEDYQQLLRQVPASPEMFLHGLYSIISGLTAQPQDPLPYPEGCWELWAALLKGPTITMPPITRSQLSGSIQHRLPLFSVFLRRLSSWLDTNNLDLDQSDLDLSQFHGLPPEDVEQTKTLALITTCSLGVFTAVCSNLDLPLDEGYLQAHAYLDIFQPDIPRLVEAAMDTNTPGWPELLHFCLMQEDALTNRRLVGFMLEHVASLQWTHLHQLLYWILQQRYLEELRELFLRLCQKFPPDYQNDVLHLVLHQLGVETGLRLPHFNHHLTLYLNKQSTEGENEVVPLFLQAPLQVLDAALAQVLSRPGQVPQLAKMLDLVPSLCKFSPGADSGLLLARLKRLVEQADLTEQQELNLLSFVSCLLQSQVLAVSELDVVLTLVLPSLHLKANFRLATLFLKAVTLDQNDPTWLHNVKETDLSLPALLLCTCSIAAHCRNVGEISRAKHLLDIATLLSCFLDWQLKGDDKDKVIAWLRLRTRELSPTVWPYLQSVVPLSEEECSVVDVGLLTPKCDHLTTLMRQVPPSQAYFQLVAAMAKLLPQCFLKEWEVIGRHFSRLLEAGVIAPSTSSVCPEGSVDLEFFHAIADALVLVGHVSVTETAWGPTLATLGAWLQNKKMVSAELAAPLTQRLLQLALATGHQGVSVLLLDLAALGSSSTTAVGNLLPHLQL